jgi:hypothetical protein
MNGAAPPVYAWGDQTELKSQYTLNRVARVPTASLATMSAWEFWNGESWVDSLDATPASILKDVEGNEIRGTPAFVKTPAGHWILVATPVADTHLSVFRAASPEGPWTPTARVPIRGANQLHGSGVSVGWQPKVVPHLPAPPEHSIVLVNSTVLGMTIDEQSGQNIRRWAPQFVAVPWF